MNNLLTYCGLVDPRISASDKDLPVHYLKHILNKIQFLEVPLDQMRDRKEPVCASSFAKTDMNLSSPISL